MMIHSNNLSPESIDGGNPGSDVSHVISIRIQ